MVASGGWVRHSRSGAGMIRSQLAERYILEEGRNERDIKRMIEAYNAKHGVGQGGYENPKGAWDSHRERIRGKLVKKMSMLRRLGCHPYGLDRPTARLVIRTMCDEISISSSEIWQLQRDEPSIDVLLNIIYRKCLKWSRI